jgi:hypothetical protein
MAKRKPNPNGANQYTFDPRQKQCWNFYTDPNSDTYGNATQSAIKAGYGKAYSDDITSAEWFRVNLWRLNSVMQGEKKLEELMNLDLKNGGDRVDVGIARIQADIAKTLVTTQGKNLGYTTKSEMDLTSKGESINHNLESESFQKLKEEFEAKARKEMGL